MARSAAIFVSSNFAIRAGLKKVDEAKKVGEEVAPHTEIFFHAGAFEIAKRYDWERTADNRAERIFELAEQYPWLPLDTSRDEILERQSEYGQAARVARYLRNVAREVNDEARVSEFEKKATAYAEHIPDQKAKL